MDSNLVPSEQLSVGMDPNLVPSEQLSELVWILTYYHQNSCLSWYGF